MVVLSVSLKLLYQQNNEHDHKRTKRVERNKSKASERASDDDNGV